ncbi:hypothetical protein J3F84DRAFT_373689 [Trichoderma pleuroticola]
MDPSHFEEEAIAAMRSFFGRASTSQRARNQLMKYLEDDPSFSPTTSIIPTEEIEIRLEMIEEIRQAHETLYPEAESFHFTTLQFSTFLLMPMDRLRIFHLDPATAFSHLKPDAYLYFMVTGKTPGENQKNSDVTSQQSSTKAPSNRSVHRSARERKKCLARDKDRCIFTKASHPEGCHILPFAINATQKNIDFFTSTEPFSLALLGTVVKHQTELLITAAPGSSDKSWNMLSLHPSLHHWWGKCFFGIKCLGIMPHDDEYSKVQVQFYWMPHHTRKPNDLVMQPYLNVIQELLQSPVNEQASLAITTDMRRDSGRELETGQTFEILVENDDAQKMKTMLDVQWAMVRLAAMSGAAQAWELDDDPDDPGEIGDVVDISTAERIERWMQTSTPSMPH